jgi:phosphoserine phosphatase
MKPYPLRYFETDQRPDDSPPPYDVIFFDCDSTLADLEGIDSLARALPADVCREIEVLTDEAMGGGRTLEEVYALRLERIQPDHAAIEALGRRYVDRLLPSAAELIAALHAAGKEVHVISGGLLPGVRHVAAELGVPPGRVHAVDIHFDSRGAFAGFERDSPLAREGGKPEVIAAAIASPGGARRAVLVGDGTTDIEASPHLARFVAFGGVKRREIVFERARVHAESRDLAALLPHLLAPEELRALGSNPSLTAFVQPFLS